MFHERHAANWAAFRSKCNLCMGADIITLRQPARHAPRAPFAATTCVPSVSHESAGSMRPSGACPACTSFIPARCAPPTDHLLPAWMEQPACTTLRARFCPARPPRDPTCGPRGAEGPSIPLGVTRVCSAGTSSGRQAHGGALRPPSLKR